MEELYGYHETINFIMYGNPFEKKNIIEEYTEDALQRLNRYAQMKLMDAFKQAKLEIYGKAVMHPNNLHLELKDFPGSELLTGFGLTETMNDVEKITHLEECQLELTNGLWAFLKTNYGFIYGIKKIDFKSWLHGYDLNSHKLAILYNEVTKKYKNYFVRNANNGKIFSWHSLATNGKDLLTPFIAGKAVNLNQLCTNLFVDFLKIHARDVVCAELKFTASSLQSAFPIAIVEKRKNTAVPTIQIVQTQPQAKPTIKKGRKPNDATQKLTEALLQALRAGSPVKPNQKAFINRGIKDAGITVDLTTRSLYRCLNEALAIFKEESSKSCDKMS